MRAIINTIFLIAIFLGGQAGVKKIHDEIKRAALTKAKKGLPSLEKFANKLSGKKLDF